MVGRFEGVAPPLRVGGPAPRRTGVVESNFPLPTFKD